MSKTAVVYMLGSFPNIIDYSFENEISLYAFFKNYGIELMAIVPSNNIIALHLLTYKTYLDRIKWVYTTPSIDFLNFMFRTGDNYIKEGIKYYIRENLEMQELLNDVDCWQFPILASIILGAA